MAFRTSRTFTVRGRPPRLAGGISEPTSAHSASVKSLSYRRPRRSAAARCSGFHMRHLSPTQVPHKESQPIPPTQLLFGTALIVGDLFVTLLLAGPELVPGRLLLFCEGPLHPHASGVHVDDDVVRMRDRMRCRYSEALAALQFLVPVDLVLDRGFEPA